MSTIPLKEAPIVFRTTRFRKALYREQAAAEGMRLSAWLRKLADQRVAEAVGQGEVRREPRAA